MNICQLSRLLEWFGRKFEREGGEGGGGKEGGTLKKHFEKNAWIMINNYFESRSWHFTITVMTHQLFELFMGWHENVNELFFYANEPMFYANELMFNALL